MKQIEVLGPGCAKCKRLEKNVNEAVASLGLKAEVIKVDDIGEIMDRGVMMTPAVVVDGNILTEGKVPSPEELMKLLK